MAYLTIFIAHPNELIRTGLRVLLSGDSGFNVLGEVARLEEIPPFVEEKKPDILVLGPFQPPEDVSNMLDQIGRSNQKTILLANQVAETEILPYLTEGVKGVLRIQTEAAEIKKAIRAVAVGEYWISRRIAAIMISEYSRQSQTDDSFYSSPESLTDREVEILKFLSKGFKTKEIANHLLISEKTVKTHLTRMFSKLKIRSRLQAALHANRYHLEAGNYQGSVI